MSLRTVVRFIIDAFLYSQSFKAYQNWIARHGEEPRLPGMNLTNEQIFFISFARVSNLRIISLVFALLIDTAVHVMIQLSCFQTAGKLRPSNR